MTQSIVGFKLRSYIPKNKNYLNHFNKESNLFQVHDVQPFSSSVFNTSHTIRHLSFGRNKIAGKANPLDDSQSVATEGKNNNKLLF